MRPEAGTDLGSARQEGENKAERESAVTPVAGDRPPIMARLPVEIATAEQSPVRLNLIAVVRADAPHITGLIIDMTRSKAVSSVQLRALGTMREHATELGIALCVAAPTEGVRRLLHLADITERTPVFPSIGAAIGATCPSFQDPRPTGRRAQYQINLTTPGRRRSW
jgi:anti-anti-sigma regulatory factor